MADTLTENIQGVNQLVSSQLNKVPVGPMKEEGVASEKVDTLSIEVDDDELLLLARQWEDSYQTYELGIKARQDANKAFYLKYVS